MAQPSPQTSNANASPVAQELTHAVETLTEFGNILNDNKDDDSEHYFNILSKHITVKPTSIPTNLTVIDSGAFPMMFQNKSYFTELFPWHNATQTHVILADGSFTASIEGIGTIRFTINNKFPVEYHNVLYVPSLSSNLFPLRNSSVIKEQLSLLKIRNSLLLFHLLSPTQKYRMKSPSPQLLPTPNQFSPPLTLQFTLLFPHTIFLPKLYKNSFQMYTTYLQRK